VVRLAPAGWKIRWSVPLPAPGDQNVPRSPSFLEHAQGPGAQS
jgi:hypothetical protein